MEGAITTLLKGQMELQAAVATLCQRLTPAGEIPRSPKHLLTKLTPMTMLRLTWTYLSEWTPEKNGLLLIGLESSPNICLEKHSGPARTSLRLKQPSMPPLKQPS